MLRNLVCAFTLLSLTTMYGQQSVSQALFPKNKLRAGFVFSDIINNRIRVDIDYRVNGPNVLGLGLGLIYGTEDMDNRIGQSLRQQVGGFYLNGSHKYYFAANKNGRTFHFTRITAAYQNANVTYLGNDFVPYIDDGITFWDYREVERLYNVQRLSAQLEIGMEFLFEYFFFEAGFGMNYSRKISDDFVPSQFTTGGRLFDIDYTGVSPTLALKLGIYLD